MTNFVDIDALLNPRFIVSCFKFDDYPYPG
jgi:hypothetical protein